MSGTTGIEAVVFDLDGLLVDSEPLQLAAWEAFLAPYGAVLTPDVLERIFGLRLVDSACVIVEMLDLPARPEDVVRDRDEIFLRTVPGGVTAMPGARKLIDALRARDIRVALATSGHRRYVDLALESAGLTGLFEVEVTGEDVQRGKPFPDVYRRAAELLRIDPRLCLALEDAPNGVRSAVDAGMPCFAVPNHSTASLSFDGAAATLGGLDEVLPAMRAAGMLDGD